MWLRHFKSQKKTRRYKAFKKRYEGFFSMDVVEICAAHHREIHIAYFRIIKMEVLKKGTSPRLWTWREARTLMQRLRAVCDSWLQTETPGATEAEFRHTY